MRETSKIWSLNITPIHTHTLRLRITDNYIILVVQDSSDLTDLLVKAIEAQEKSTRQRETRVRNFGESEFRGESFGWKR